MLSWLKKQTLGPNTPELYEILTRNSQKKIIEVPFGWLGNVYFIDPSRVPLPALLNKLDMQDQGRQAMGVVDYVLGGPSLLASTGPTALERHKLFSQSLFRPTDFITITLQSLSACQPIEGRRDLSEWVTQHIRSIITQGMFNIKDFPSDFAQAMAVLCRANKNSEEDRAEEVRQQLYGIKGVHYFSSLLSLLTRSAKKSYQHNIKAFLKSQEANVLADLKRYGEHQEKLTNILSLSILHLMKQKYPENWSQVLENLTQNQLPLYLEDAYIQTVPGMLVAADSIILPIMTALQELHHNPELKMQLSTEIALLLQGDANDIRQAIHANKENGGLLHGFYLEALRLSASRGALQNKQFASLTWRYTNQNLEIEGEQIPAHSMLAFLNALPLFDQGKWQDPEVFNPMRYQDKAAYKSISLFSKGHRKCPASDVTEYIIKVFIAHALGSPELDLLEAPNLSS